jgi:NAD(P)-dependent dehydrogenase (short-subunit alcohol dehydrogenase family)
MGGGSEWLGLKGRTVAVTGAAGGIGGAIAAGATAVGAAVALLDREGAACEAVAAMLRDRGGEAVAIECDTSSEESVRAAAEEAERRLGRVEILVNNAGFLTPGAIAEVSRADWDAMLGVNLTGYLLCAQAFGRRMIEAGRGSLVHIASIAASHAQPRSGAYSASKAGVVLLSRQLAVEWGPSGIRSNVVSPGLVRTPLSERFYQEPGITERRSAMVASRRIGRPEDIADVVLFLASGRSAYVNGAEIVVDGGFGTMLMELVPRPGFAPPR